MAKCIKQINRCYSFNRIQKNPVQYYVSSCNAPEMMKKYNGWEHWDVNQQSIYTNLIYERFFDRFLFYAG